VQTQLIVQKSDSNRTAPAYKTDRVIADGEAAQLCARWTPSGVCLGSRWHTCDMGQQCRWDRSRSTCNCCDGGAEHQNGHLTERKSHSTRMRKGVGIFWMNADGTHQVRLTDDSSDHRGPSWSADGEWVYFTSNRSGNWEIWKISARTKKSIQVTSQRSGAYGQESPDGKFLYCQESKFGTKWDFGLPSAIWKMPSGEGPEELVWRGEDPGFLS
jgi:hypothetical protein